MSANTSVLWFMGSILAFLVLPAAVEGLPYRYNAIDWVYVRERVRTWGVIALIFISTMIPNRALALTLIGYACFQAYKDYLTLIPTRRSDHRILFLSCFLVPLQIYLVSQSWYRPFLAVIPVFAFLILPGLMAFKGDKEGLLKAVSQMSFGLILTVYGLSHLAYFLVLPVSFNLDRTSVDLLIYLLVLTQAYDAGQVIAGKLMGQTPFLPQLTSQKTWEGIIGGLILTFVLGLALAPYLTSLSFQQSLMATSVISLGSFMGSVTVSAIKGSLNVLESKVAWPGYGGILSRMASLIYTAPLFFHLIRMYHG